MKLRVQIDGKGFFSRISVSVEVEGFPADLVKFLVHLRDSMKK